MKSVQSTLFVSILILILGVSVQAQAAPSSQPNTLSAHDLELLFEQDGEPLQLALLSEKEMAETEGAWTFLALRKFLVAGGQWAGVIRSFRVKVHYDRKPHYFTKEQWGPLEGNRPHIQITAWRKGVKGSNWDGRIPAGRTRSHGSHPAHRN